MTMVEIILMDNPAFCGPCDTFRSLVPLMEEGKVGSRRGKGHLHLWHLSHLLFHLLHSAPSGWERLCCNADDNVKGGARMWGTQSEMQNDRFYSQQAVTIHYKLNWVLCVSPFSPDITHSVDEGNQRDHHLWIHTQITNISFCVCTQSKRACSEQTHTCCWCACLHSCVNGFECMHALHTHLCSVSVVGYVFPEAHMRRDWNSPPFLSSSPATTTVALCTGSNKHPIKKEIHAPAVWDKALCLYHWWTRFFLLYFEFGLLSHAPSSFAFSMCESCLSACLCRFTKGSKLSTLQLFYAWNILASSICQYSVLT